MSNGPIVTSSGIAGLLAVSDKNIVTPGGGVGVWGYYGALPVPTQASVPPTLCGVFGQGGVVGVSNFSGTVATTGNDGVVGFSDSNGVNGTSTSGNGVSGTSTSGSGVKGISTSGVGVAGEGQASSAGVYGANSSSANGGPGVFGTSVTFDGVHGESQSNQHAGASGINTAATGGYTGSGSGVPAGVFGSGNPGGYFQGNPAGWFQGDVTVTGTLTAQVDVVLGSDCAEDFDIAPFVDIDPGTVMVLTDDGALEPSQNAYDKKVAGVISGAGEYRPGLILGRSKSSPQRMPLALVGKVYCKVDADPAPVAVGDLLTTSGRAGFAMKATDAAQAFGAVIGKALKPLRDGQGMIPILVALQ